MALEIAPQRHFCSDRIVAYLFRADLWTPLVEAAFVAVNQVGHDHSRDGKDQYTDENFIGLEGRAGNRDHEANAGRRGIKLADHNADQSAPYSQAKSRQDERNS